MKSKISALAVFLALATVIATSSMAQAVPQNWFDLQQGTYTEVLVGIAGTLFQMKLYNPAAFVKGTIDQNLPYPFTMIIYWYFEWEDLNHTVYTYTNVTLTRFTQADQYIKIQPPVSPPSQVIYIYVEGRAGYDGVWDTPFASVGIPYD